MLQIRRVAALGVFAVGLALVIFGVGVMTVSATPPPDHKVVICHATGSQSNPFVQLSVDIASSGFVEGGHNNHPNDIIPPYVYGTFHFPGKNWTAQGQAIWVSGCQMAPASPKPSPTGGPPHPTPSPSASPTASSPSAGSSPGGGAVSAGSAPSPSGTGEALAATGDTSTPEAIGAILASLGFLAMAVGVIAYRRRDA
jgi:hypothetical protein